MRKTITETQLRSLIRKELKKQLKEYGTPYDGDLAYYVIDAGEYGQFSMEENLENNTATIADDAGNIIADYEFGGAGVTSVMVSDPKELINALVGLIYKYGKKQ